MSTTEHLALQKFQAIHMPLRCAITPRQGAGSMNSCIVATNAIDKAAEFRHTAFFCSLEPGVQCLRLPFFEQGHKFLAQHVDGVEFVVEGYLLNLVPLHRREFRGG